MIQFLFCCSERDQYDDLDIYNLEERVTEFHDGFLEDLQNQTVEDQDQTVNPWNNEQFKIIHHFRLLVLRSCKLTLSINFGE